MDSDSWDVVAAQMKKSIIDERSILSQFPSEAASITAREIVLSLTADCSCKKAVVVGATVPVDAAPLAAPGLHKRPLGRHAINATEAKVTTVEAHSKRFSVKIDTEADLQWVMQAVNYGLTMPPEHWDIVTHSVHLCCEWLSCLLPAQSQRVVHIPRALHASPVVYARRLLFALCRFFAPRAPMDRPTGGIFSLLHQPPRDPPDHACIAAGISANNTVEEIVHKVTFINMPDSIIPLNLDAALGVVQPNAGMVVGDGERWLQEKYIPLVSRIINRVEQILLTSHLLTASLWDNLLEFCLAICYAVLAPPPQIEYSAVTNSRAFSQSPGARGMLQLECLVVGLLNRVWIRALSHHYPSPAYWQGLRELCYVSRHRIGLSYIWSRILVVFTCSLIRSQGVTKLSYPPSVLEEGNVANTAKVCPLNLPPLSAFEPLLSRKLMVELPEEVANISWFLLLHLFGNPVDLCHPAEITHTAVFEHFRRSNAAARCRLTVAFLPAIFHHVMRSLSVMVDLFLGIAPSLSGCLSTFIGVPPSLYGPLVDVPEYFQYASVRSPDINFTNKIQVSVDPLGSTDLPSPDSSVQKIVHSAASSTDIVCSVSSPSSLINPQAVAEAWLQPDFLVTCFYNRPHVTSFMRLLGPWLFEAAVGHNTEGTIIRERSLKVDNTSFLVGRAEAMACLCRIFIYAQKNQITLNLLTRFYICLIRALDPEVEYVVSTVLFHAPDLLRADLTACFSSVVPALFNAAQWVLRKPCIVCPEYVSMVLLRRASLHQLLSMVCLPNQFDGIQFQDISSPSSASSDSGTLTTRTLRLKLAELLCELLAFETDTHNLRMLLSAAYTLVLDMIAVELSAPESKSKPPPNNADSSPNVETASGLYALLLDRICICLRRWTNDFAVSSFALDILSGLANTHVPHPSLARCRRCIQSICAFIEAQCRREKKDHTRLLHSLIINAFHCLGVWLVAQPNGLNDQETLRAVVETTKLGIFGDETVPLPPPGSKIVGSLGGPSLPSGMPFSKRVNEAAEQLLTTLFAAAGSFPQAGGPETISCRLTEEQVIQLSATSTSAFQHFLVALPTMSASAPTTPDLLLSIAETMRSPSNACNKREIEGPPVLRRSVTNPSPVFTFFRDASGRHLWSWKLRYEPISAGEDTTNTLRPRNIRHFKSYLESSWPIRQSEDVGDPFMPRTRDNIPLVRAEKEMPTLAHSVMGSVARREVDALKSLIVSEAERAAALGRRIRKARIKAFNSSNSEEQCRPEQRIDQMCSGHLLACHLGYVPVNALQGPNNSFCVPRDTNAGSNDVTSQSQPHSTAAPLAHLSAEKRIPGTRDAGGGVDPSLLIPSALIPVSPSLAKQLDDQSLTSQRSSATAFVFYVKKGQTSLEDVISNMAYWTETSKDFQSFLHSLGWCVEFAQHPGWCGPLQRSQPSRLNRSDATTAHLSGFDVRLRSAGVDCDAVEGLQWKVPDGEEIFFYWADAFTELVALCPSQRTKINKKPLEDRSSAEDFRAAILWLESWDDALWIPGWASENKGNVDNPTESTLATPALSNPLVTALEVKFSCGLVVLVHPLSSNGLFRFGLLRLHDLGHEAGPLTTGLLLSAPLLGAMVRSTLVNTLHRLAADSGDPTNTTARKRLAATAASAATGCTKGRFASAVQLLVWSAEQCY